MRLELTMTEALHDYVTGISPPEPGPLRAVREEAGYLGAGMMQVPPQEARFLATLIKAVGARRTLEVGVFTGYSLLATVLALPPDGQVVALDISEEWTSLAMAHCRRAGVAHQVDLRVGDARDTLAALLAEDGAAGSFDFAFIDANKEGYADYFDGALALLRPGGVIVVDNVLWHGAVADPDATDSETEAVRAFNERVRNDDRVDYAVLPLADGMTVAVKR
ncbi:class I SAM-dependent methyltransferase [Actinosynnema sp. NPDC023587]|uniref:O-methyltransferase n=1 Tax=Actinosynnema sp. NPDC023587 TaxID=3154695 RepID=UPI0033FE8AFA